MRSRRAEPAMALADRTLTYRPVGATEPARVDWSDPPSGFRALTSTTFLGGGDACWADATSSVLEWAVKTRSGFSVEAPAGPVQVGRRCLVGAQLGPIRITEPVEVVAVVETEARVGFAYGTLSGHPVSGEEAFIVHRDDQSRVWLTLRSLTRAAPTGGWRWAFPVLLVAQRVFRWRYQRALVCR